MKNSLLTELLLTLSGDERDEFRLFVQSPYFNRGSDAAEVLALLDVLANLATQQSEEDAWEKSSVFGAAYPGQPWSVKKMDKRMSKLLQLLRRFIVERFLTKDAESPEFGMALAEHYLQHGLKRRFESAIGEIERQLEALPWRDDRYFELVMKKALLRQKHEILYRYRHTDFNLKQALENLWLYYHVRRLELRGALMSHKKGVAMRETPDLTLDETEAPLPVAFTERFPILYLREAMCEAIKKNAPTPAEIEHFQAFLKRRKDEIPFDDRLYFATLLRNLCARRNNELAPDLLKLLHALHMEHLEEGYLFYTPGKIANRTFSNIVNVALICREDMWVEQFIEQYREKIIGDTETQDYYRFARAQLLAFRKKWEEALDVLPGPFQRVEEGLVRNRLEIIILYELQSPLLLSRLEAFKVYLSRFGVKLLSPVKKKRQVEFVNFVYQLLRAKPGDIRRAQKIKDRILAIPNLPDKAWLLEQVEAPGKAAARTRLLNF